MKAIILSAGRGSRLLPLTTDIPKCLLQIGETTVLGYQLQTLIKCGIKDVHIITGFKEDLVEAELSHYKKDLNITTKFNPFFHVSDNLASCWLSRAAMDNNFLLINGDTLFEASLLKSVLASPRNDIQVTIDHKDKYDSDDMKVTLSETDQLLSIGKHLNARKTDGESIGILRFMGEGVFKFRMILDKIMRTPEGPDAWFLSAIDNLAKSGVPIMTHSIDGLKWAELDNQDDYIICKRLFANLENNVLQIKSAAQ